MIFLLLNSVTSDYIVLNQEQDNIIGRIKATIVLENSSVSRKHAIIRIKNNEAVLEDCGSKFFSYHNKAKLQAGVEVKLNHLDKLCFGADTTIYQFEKYAFITAATSLSSANKKVLSDYVAKCGGKFVNEWSNICTHLTVEHIAITIKFLQAIIDQKPVVNLNYWLNYSTAIRNGTPLPPVPQLTNLPLDKTVSHLDISKCLPNLIRKQLFKNKVFVFYNTDIMQEMSIVIKKCGGEYIAWEDKPSDFTKQINKGDKEYLFMTYQDQLNDSFNAVLNDLKKQNKRPIALSEIALSVIYCSCEINCNPCANKVKNVFAIDTEISQTMNVMTTETETPNTISETPVVNTIESTQDIIVGTKRSHATVQADDSEKPKRAKVIGDSQIAEPSIIVVHPVASCSQSSVEFSSFKKPLCQKRKAEDNSDTNANKKPNLFKSININQSSLSAEIEENPFKLSRNIRSKPAVSKNKNPFNNIDLIGGTINEAPCEQIRETEKENIVAVKPQYNDDIKIEIKEEILTGHPQKNNSTLNSTWISKTNNSQIKNASVPKESPELLKIFKAFENCVRIEVLELPIRTTQAIRDDSSLSTSSARKNFKKFKKIPPLRPQRDVINLQNYKNVPVRNLELFGDQVSNRNDSDDEDIVLSSNKSKPKPRTRKFVF